MTGPAIRSFGLAFSLLLTGCGCTSPRRAARLNAELRATNLERADAACQAAAASVGAQLTALRAQSLYLRYCPGGKLVDIPTPPFPPGGDDGCVTWQSTDRSAFRFLDTHGVARLAFNVRREEYDFARLARRGNAFFVLEPDMSRRTVDEGEQCYCDGGYGLHFEPHYVAFVIDDLEHYELSTLKVPIVKDVIDWTCNVRLVEADRPLLALAPLT